MGVTKQQAAENREAIVAAAGKLFRERGVDAVGLTELMRAAGFTQGGFYNHFKSKDALVAAVMEQAMSDGARLVPDLRADLRAQAGESSAEAVRQRIARYLCADHREGIEAGCPLAAFLGDARRLSREAHESYAHGLARYLADFAAVVADKNGTAEGSRGEAIALYSQMIGALMLSRAIVDVDPALADEILDAGGEHLLRSVGQ